MLNKKGQRELAYIVKIDDVKDIEGVNNQIAIVNGWQVFVKRDEFRPGDLAVYFEIDSKVPERECFEFLRKYGFKVKTQKFVKGKVLSQGLLIHPKELGLKNYKEGDFLTKELGVTYYDPEDNIRKADNSRETSMKARHPKFFKSGFGKWLMKRSWGRKICFLIFGHKKEKKIDFPDWVVKTDEERCQNCFNEMSKLDTSWIATEKIDGSSSTFTMKQAKPKKRKMLVCSRNVVFDSPKKEDKNYYKDTEGNIYIEVAEKYGIETKLNAILDSHKEWEFVTIQGEIYGRGVQKRDYGINDHFLAVFNVIYKENGKAPVRMNPIEMYFFLTDTRWLLPTVPIIGIMELPATCEDLLRTANDISQIDGGMREGIVLRSIDGVHSFKAVSNEYLIKYHL